MALRKTLITVQELNPGGWLERVSSLTGGRRLTRAVLDLNVGRSVIADLHAAARSPYADCRVGGLVTMAIWPHAGYMAELTKNGVKIRIEIWVDNGKIIFSNVDGDFGPKGLIGSFIPGSAAEQHARELLERHGKLPKHA